MLEEVVRRLGHETIATADGTEALAFVADGGGVRVIISDWMMPGIDGLELCRRIRSRSAADYIYFILLTGQTANEENQRAAAEAGVDDFLSKPVKPQSLWNRLRVAERILNFTTQVRQLESFLPICSYCKKVRD